jgi:hypothetical protein
MDRNLMRLAFTTLALLILFSCIPIDAQDFSKVNLHIGGGIGVPTGETGRFAGLSGAFQIGAGPNLSAHNSLVGEFMWQGLPPNNNALSAVANPLCGGSLTLSCAITLTQNFGTSSNLYVVTANYMYHREGHVYGFYLIAGGGWYYRHLELLNYTVVPGTVCEPAWDWWGYTCQNGFITTGNTLAVRGVSSGGGNAGGGITLKVTSSGLRLYMEARYHYSPEAGRISTHVVPVMFGIRW